MNRVQAILALILTLTVSLTAGFAPNRSFTTRLSFQHHELAATDGKSAADSEVIARRIIVTGDVQGGYYRSCVLNEVRFLKDCIYWNRCVHHDFLPSVQFAGK